MRWCVALVVAASLGATVAVVTHRGIGPQAIYDDSTGTPVASSPLPTEAPPRDAPDRNRAFPPPPSADLAWSFHELERQSSASIGVVVVPLGRREPGLRLGHWSVVDPAWSTMKVPLAVAALHAGTSTQAVISAAITESDNASAELMWSQLGEPTSAAQRVQAVLSSAGDPTTVESQRIRPGFSAFGQTWWPLPEQAAFLAHSACDPNDATILDLMGHVQADQRWGLGELPGARFKGGWGPSPDGSYVVRQMGVIMTPSGRAAVALSAHPESGSFTDGASALTTTANWLNSHLSKLPAGACG